VKVPFIHLGMGQAFPSHIAGLDERALRTGAIHPKS
jgi:hypothetical protein